MIKSAHNTLVLKKKTATPNLKTETKGGIEFICIKGGRLSRNASFTQTGS